MPAQRRVGLGPRDLRQLLAGAAHGHRLQHLLPDPGRRLAAVEPRQLRLYGSEASAQVREDLQAMVISGASEKLAEVARAEADAALRKTAIHDLGMMNSKKTGVALAQFYREDKDPGAKKAAIQGLFMQGNAAALVALARQEKDPDFARKSCRASR